MFFLGLLTGLVLGIPLGGAAGYVYLSVTKKSVATSTAVEQPKV